MVEQGSSRRRRQRQCRHGRSRLSLIRSQGHYLISDSPSLYNPRGQIVFNLSEIRGELALKWMVSIKVRCAVQADI